MRYAKLFITKITITVPLTFTACSTHETAGPNGYVYKAINFGENRSETYIKGIKDGCKTAQGEYRKNHQLFKNDNMYHDGWFAGRNKCRQIGYTSE